MMRPLAREHPARPTRPYPVALTVRGIWVVAAGVAMYIVLGTILGEPNAPLFGVPLLLSLACIRLVPRHSRTRTPVGLAALAVLAVLVLDPFRLTHPDNFLDFASPVTIVAGLLTVVTGTALGFVGSRARVERAVKAVMRAGALLLVAVVLASAALTLAPSGRVGAAGEVLVVTEDSRFDPDELDVGPGARILVRNVDWFAHTFTVFDLGISEYVPPRGETLIEIPPNAAAANYPLTCEVLGHWDMDGTLLVRGGVIP